MFSSLCSFSIKVWGLGHSRSFLTNNNSVNLDRILSPASPGHFSSWWLGTGDLANIMPVCGGESKAQTGESLALCSVHRVRVRVDEGLWKLLYLSQETVVIRSQPWGSEQPGLEFLLWFLPAPRHVGNGLTSLRLHFLIDKAEQSLLCTFTSRSKYQSNQSIY